MWYSFDSDLHRTFECRVVEEDETWVVHNKRAINDGSNMHLLRLVFLRHPPLRYTSFPLMLLCIILEGARKMHFWLRMICSYNKPTNNGALFCGGDHHDG